MLKTTLNIIDNIDISKFYKLVALIKNKRKGHKFKKFKILEKDHLVTFLEAAPDLTFLMIKVIYNSKYLYFIYKQVPINFI